LKKNMVASRPIQVNKFETNIQNLESHQVNNMKKFIKNLIANT